MNDTSICLKDIIPDKPVYWDLSDREWETYCIETWCLNSLNAVEGSLKGKTSMDNFILMSIVERDNICEYLRRAQEVISALLKETGRV